MSEVGRRTWVFAVPKSRLLKYLHARVEYSQRRAEHYREAFNTTTQELAALQQKHIMRGLRPLNLNTQTVTSQAPEMASEERALKDAQYRMQSKFQEHEGLVKEFSAWETTFSYPMSTYPQDTPTVWLAHDDMLYFGLDKSLESWTADDEHDAE